MPNARSIATGAALLSLASCRATATPAGPIVVAPAPAPHEVAPATEIPRATVASAPRGAPAVLARGVGDAWLGAFRARAESKVAARPEGTEPRVAHTLGEIGRSSAR